MTSTIVPGRRLFIAGCVVFLLMGAVHLIPVYRSNFLPQTDPPMIEVDRAALAAKVDIGPFHTTAWHLVQLLNASYSVLILYAAVMNLVVLPAAIAGGRMRALTIVNVIFVGLLSALLAVYRFPPPMVFAVASLTLFVASLIRQR